MNTCKKAPSDTYLIFKPIVTCITIRYIKGTKWTLIDRFLSKAGLFKDKIVFF